VVYYTLIELLNATPDDYAKLDDRMDLAGFMRTACSKTGQPYKLPRGVYRSQCSHHASKVLDVAREAADSTGCKNEVMTIESAGARWIPNTDWVSAELMSNEDNPSV
jgi:hypothetical protein